MTIAILTLQLGGIGWSIQSPDGRFQIDAKEACIDKKCKPTGDVTVDGRGMWHLASIDVDLRWASTETVEIRTAESSWLPADFKVETPVERLPAASVVERITRWDRGVLPGTWLLGSTECASDKTAWLYRPILESAPGTAVIPGPDGATVTEGAKAEPCKEAPERMKVSITKE